MSKNGSRKDAKKFSKQTRNNQRKEKEAKNTNPIVEEDVIPQSQTEWSASKVVNGVEYSHAHADSLIWRARDGSKRLIAGPEQIEGEHWFYISELNDYFAVKTRYNGSEYIDIDGPGLLEMFMACDRNAIERLKKMEFKMKTLVEDATGKPMTFEVLRMEYNKNPRYPQEFTYGGYSDDSDSDPVLDLKCPHYSSYNWEYGSSGSLYRW